MLSPFTKNINHSSSLASPVPQNRLRVGTHNFRVAKHRAIAETGQGTKFISNITTIVAFAVLFAALIAGATIGRRKNCQRGGKTSNTDTKVRKRFPPAGKSLPFTFNVDAAWRGLAG